MKCRLSLYVLLAAFLAATCAISCPSDPHSPDEKDPDSNPLCPHIINTIPHYQRGKTSNNLGIDMRQFMDHHKCPPGTELDPPRRGIRYPSLIPICVRTNRKDLPSPADDNHDPQEDTPMDHHKCPPGTELDPPRPGVRYPSLIPICVPTNRKDLPPPADDNQDHQEESPKNDEDDKKPTSKTSGN